MAEIYASADKVLQVNAKVSWAERAFALILLASTIVHFEEKSSTLDAALKDDKNEEDRRFSLRTQLIQDPTRPIGGSLQILQFFAVDPNPDSLMTADAAAVIVETTDGKEIPLALLSSAEVSRLAYGEGFSIPLRK